LAVALPASVVLWYAAELVVLVLYQRGSFDAASAQLTVAALRGYALGLAGFSVAEITVRIWFALKNTRVPVIVGAGAVALNLGLGWWLSQTGSPIERLSATATVFSIANTVEAAVLLWWLMRRYASIRIFDKSWMWLVGIGGMVVLLQISTPFLPGLPTHNLHSSADWLRVALYAGFYGVCGIWGIGWCSQWFALLRATRRRADSNPSA
jgi:peptidoglycan biosynthesis protein MviN/MurJ (putative lipid II flippase)